MRRMPSTAQWESELKGKGEEEENSGKAGESSKKGCEWKHGCPGLMPSADHAFMLRDQYMALCLRHSGH